VEVDGYLYESPITWYTSKQKWDMSPGYDAAGHASFERPVVTGCLSCHAGRLDQAPDSSRLRIHEKSIGCESCHGPGSRHAELHRAGTPPPGEDDLTIVNPAKLPRDRLEAVCANCHLNAVVAAPARGREPTDFRPGLPLTDFRTDYKFDSGTEEMTVVGHIEQLRRSACYQKSDTLTCISCHEPHAREKPKDLIAFYRQKCMECHETKPCKSPPAERLKKQPADDCAACHMPRGDTDIPHISFTHHRIGHHALTAKGLRAPGPAVPEQTPNLVPFQDVSGLAEYERQRNLGVAYMLCADLPQYKKHADIFRARTRELLEPLHAQGLPDPMLPLAIANAVWRTDRARAAAYAQEALDAKQLPPELRAGVLVIRADCFLQEGKIEPAINLLEEVVRLRRRTEDWRLLGRLYLEQHQPRKALPALEQALSIRPYRYDIHGALSETYRQLGDQARAREHREKALWLQRNNQE
jgi:predicted CXXCH cytochrome family protein